MRSGHCHLYPIEAPTTAHIGIGAKLDLLSLGYLYPHQVWVHRISGAVR